MIQSETIVSVQSEIERPRLKSEVVFLNDIGEEIFRITEDDFIRELENGDLRILEHG